MVIGANLQGVLDSYELMESKLKGNWTESSALHEKNIKSTMWGVYEYMELMPKFLEALNKYSSWSCRKQYLELEKRKVNVMKLGEVEVEKKPTHVKHHLFQEELNLSLLGETKLKKIFLNLFGDEWGKAIYDDEKQCASLKNFPAGYEREVNELLENDDEIAEVKKKNFKKEFSGILKKLNQRVDDFDQASTLLKGKFLELGETAKQLDERLEAINSGESSDVEGLKFALRGLLDSYGEYLGQIETVSNAFKEVFSVTDEASKLLVDEDDDDSSSESEDDDYGHGDPKLRFNIEFDQFEDALMSDDDSSEKDN